MKSRAQLGTGTHDALRPACPTSSDRARSWHKLKHRYFAFWVELQKVPRQNFRYIPVLIYPFGFRQKK